MRLLRLAICSVVFATPVRAAVTEEQVSRRIEAATPLLFANPNAASVEADRLIAASVIIPEERGRYIAQAGSYRLKAEAVLRINDIDLAEKAIATSLSMIERAAPTSKLAGEALLTRGGVYSLRGQVALALGDYQRAYRIFHARGDSRSQAVALLYIANLYSDARDYDTVLRYLNQASELKIGDARVELSIANNRGNALQNSNRYLDARRIFEQAIDQASLLPGVRVQILGNLAWSLLYANDVRQAEVIIRRAQRLDEEQGTGASKSRLLAIAAEAALRQGRLRDAGEMIGRSFAGVNLRTTTITSRDAHETAYRTFVRLGKPTEALAHLEALKRLDDEATKLATNTGTALMGARFDFANQELRIAKLRAEDLRRRVEAEQARTRFERTIFLVVGGATAAIIALLGWLLFTIRRSRDRIRVARDTLAETNAALGKALAAKTEFLATTSHEIRTPLNGILGMTQVMLADGSLAPTVRERLGIVHTAGTTMRALVDDILDVAKMETGNLTIENAPFDLRETLRAATLLWEAQCRAKGLRFEADIGHCPAQVCGDAARVRQVVFNLLANAVKFTAEGSVTLTARGDHDAGMINIAVTDTGIGIASDQHDAIFDAFRQADASTTRRFGGTGLGLSISRNLAQAMGGSVRVESVPDAGATFTLTIPLRQVERDPCAPQPEVSCDILVVERNPIARAMWTSLFAPRPLAFVGAAEAMEAVGARGGATTLMVDDVTIAADLDRAAAIAGAARAAGMRVVQLWPAGREGDREALVAAGVDAVVVRPFTREALLAALGETAILDPLVSQAA